MKVDLSKETDKTILVIDDSELSRALIENIFNKKYTVKSLNNGKSGLEYLKEHEDEIVAILLDRVMPGMSGLEMLRIMREERLGDDIPVFLITADNSEEVMYEGYDLGVKDIIEKPFVPYFLERRVENLIELYKTKKDLKETIEYQSQIISKKIDELKKINSSVLETLILAIEFRSEETGQHVQNIRNLTYKLLSKLKDLGYESCKDFTEEEMDTISNASTLHDIGKIVIPDVILNKPGRLTPEEFEIMKTHTLQGAELIGKIPKAGNEALFKYAYDICRHHHERWDGRGYPDGLKGEEISIWSQVVALADVYDALTSSRCYKKAFTKEESINMITTGKCGTFNPDLIKAFLEIEKDL
jgi:putative two-component system response regulator